VIEYLLVDIYRNLNQTLLYRQEENGQSCPGFSVFGKEGERDHLLKGIRTTAKSKKEQKYLEV
jgi:hypothetical protein